MPWGGPYVATNWINGTTPLSQTNMNHLETIYQLATQTFEQDLFSPFVLYGLVATKDGSIATQLDTTAGVAFLVQTDGTVARQSIASTAGTLVTTGHPSTTLYLDLNPNGTYSFATTHSATANFLAIAQVTTDGSSNILTVTDERATGPAVVPGSLGAFTVNNLNLRQTANLSLSGTVHGLVTYGQVGPVTGDTAALFDGSTGHISIPTTGLPTSGSLSIECWVWASAWSGNPNPVSLGTNFSTEGFYLGINSTGGAYAGNFAANIAASANMSTSTWHHLVGTYDGTNTRCYVDGALTGGPTAQTVASVYGTCDIGSLLGASAFFSGRIAQVAIYSTALSAARVSAHFAAASSGYAAAVLADNPDNYYRLSDAPGSASALDTTAINVPIVDSGGNATFPGSVSLGSPLAGSQSGIAYNGPNQAVQLNSPQGSAFNTGFYFIVWNGAAGQIPLAIGDQDFASASSLIGGGGNVAQLAGQATAGSFGVPMVVAQALDTHVTVTTLQTILTYTPSTNQKLRINATFAANNGGTNQPTVIFSFTGSSYSSAVTYNMALNNAVLLNGGNTVSAQQDFAATSEIFAAKANTAVTCKYQNSTGTPNDFITFIIERLA